MLIRKDTKRIEINQGSFGGLALLTLQVESLFQTKGGWDQGRFGRSYEAVENFRGSCPSNEFSFLRVGGSYNGRSWYLHIKKLKLKAILGSHKIFGFGFGTLPLWSFTYYIFAICTRFAQVKNSELLWKSRVALKGWKPWWRNGMLKPALSTPMRRGSQSIGLWQRNIGLSTVLNFTDSLENELTSRILGPKWN